VTVSLLKAPAGFPAPSDYPELFYRCKIGGVLMPGVIPPNGISGWSLVTDHDVKKGKGADDATSTDTGDPPPKGTVKTQLWRKGVNDRGEDDRTFPTTSRNGRLRQDAPQARRAKKALDIVHPIINQLEVTSVYVTKIGQITDEGLGLWTAELELEKWAPEPKDAAARPTAPTARWAARSRTSKAGSTVVTTRPCRPSSKRSGRKSEPTARSSPIERTRTSPTRRPTNELRDAHEPLDRLRRHRGARASSRVGGDLERCSSRAIATRVLVGVRHASRSARSCIAGTDAPRLDAFVDVGAYRIVGGADGWGKTIPEDELSRARRSSRRLRKTLRASSARPSSSTPAPSVMVGPLLAVRRARLAHAFEDSRGRALVGRDRTASRTSAIAPRRQRPRRASSTSIPRLGSRP
jgi:hypothetical protein